MALIFEDSVKEIRELREHDEEIERLEFIERQRDFMLLEIIDNENLTEIGKVKEAFKLGLELGKKDGSD